jgi:tRNA splicing endonuclease
MFSIETIKLMNSAEALKKAKENKPRKPGIDHLVKIVAEEIHLATLEGGTSLSKDPFVGLRMLPPSAEQRRELYKHLREKGYTIRGGIISWGK